MNRRRKLSAIIFFLSITAACLLYARTLDAFTPGHIASALHAVHTGELPRVFKAGYVFLGVYYYVLGVSASELMFLPFQLFPTIVLIWVVTKSISKSTIFASLVLFLQSVTGLKGTNYLYYGPHGLGQLLIYTLLILWLIMMENPPFRMRRNKEISVVFVAVALLLPLLSYNRAVQFMLLGGWIWILTNFLGSQNEWVDGTHHNILNFAFIALIIEIGILKFFTTSVAGILFDASINNLGTIDKLIAYFLSTDQLHPALAEIYLVRPSILTAIAAIKYAILVPALCLLVSAGVYRVVRLRGLSIRHFIVIAYSGAIGTYMLLRVPVGAIVIPVLHVPAIFTLAWLYQTDWSFSRGSISITSSKVASVVVCVLVVLALGYVTVAIQSDIRMEHDESLAQSETTTDWIGTYAAPAPIRTSVNMGGLLQLHSVDRPYSYERITKQIRGLTREDVIAIATSGTLGEGYTVLSYQHNIVTLRNWISLESWESSRDRIRENPSLSKIYSTGNVTVSKTVQ